MRYFRELLRGLTCTHPAEWTSDTIEIANSNIVFARQARRVCVRCGRVRRVTV